MMIQKYGDHWVNMYDYINNRIHAGIKKEELTREVFDKFKTELLYYDCSPKMIKEFLLQMVSVSAHIICLNQKEKENKDE